MTTECFEGLTFFVDLDGAGSWDGQSLKRYITESIPRHGGKVASVYHQDCTHLVLRHKAQDLYSVAQQLDQIVVSADFIIKCLSEKRLLEETEQGVYDAAEIPEFRQRVTEMTQTDFRGLERLILRYKCECTGAPYSGVMTVPARTSHLIVKNLSSCTEKIEKAKRHPSVHIVSAEWLEECLRKWRFVPEDSYKTTNHIAESSDEGQITPGPPFSGQVDATPQGHLGEAWNTNKNDAENSVLDLDPTMPVDVEMGDLIEDPNEGGPQNKNSAGNLTRECLAPSEDFKSTVDGVLLSDDASLPTCGLDMSQQVAKASDIVGHLASQVNPMSQSGPSGHAKEDDDTKEGTKQQGDTEDHARIEGMELVAPTQNLSQGLDVKMQDPDSKTAHQRTQGGAGDELYSETLPDDGNMPIRAIGTQSRKDVGAETCNGISGPETQQREGTRMSIKQSEKDRTVPATPGNKKSQVENEKKDTSVALPVEKDTVKETTKGRGKRGRPKKIPSKETKRNDKKLKNNDGLKAKPEVVPPVEQARAETSQKETLVKPTAKRGRPKKEAPSPDIRESGKQGQNEGARVKSGRKRGIQETELKPSSKAKQSRSQQGWQQSNFRKVTTPTKSLPPLGPSAKRTKRDKSFDEPIDPSTAFFALSMMKKVQRTKFTQILRSLKVKLHGGMGTDPHSYDTKITHIIIEELKRNDKTMCGMAAGNWIMDAKFVEQCGIEKKLLEPVQYEHKATDIDNITTGSPSHWRVRRNRLGVGAFDGVSAVIYGKLSTPENDTIKRIITSGGGRVIKMSPPFDSVCGPAGANLAIIGDSKDKDADRHIKALKKAGVLCVRTQYIVDWIAHPAMDLSEHRLFPGQDCGTLKDLEEDRRRGGIM